MAHSSPPLHAAPRLSSSSRRAAGALRHAAAAATGRPSARRAPRPACSAVASAEQPTLVLPEVTAGGFDFAAYVARQSVVVERALAASVPQQEPASIHEAMRYSLLAGGKRIRPLLCLAACELVGGDPAVALPTACALEMIHTMSLIHDDLPSMDNDDFRRGKPTCHKVYGEEVAILAGDALLSRSFEHIARDTRGAPAEAVLRVIADVGKAVGSEGLVAGQIVDLEMEGRGGAGAGLDTLRYIHAHKTGALLEAAVVSGAVLGGACEAQVAALGRYAQAVGLAFQVIDDILDVTQTSEQLGKTAGKDVAVGKATYPSLLGLDASRRVADDLIADAKRELASFDAQKALPLVGLADFIASRKQ